MKIIFLLFLFLLTSSTATDSTAQNRQRYDPCSGSTTQDINECAKREYDKADAELNKVYRELISKVKDVRLKNKLIAAQRTWIKFRDESCNFVYEFHKEGTMRTVMLLGCLTMTTENRTKELRIIMKEAFEG